jgi:hypothetical protein
MMAGLFNDIGEFFTGDKAEKLEKEQAAQTAASTAERETEQAQLASDRAGLATSQTQQQGQINAMGQTANQFGQQASQANALANRYNQGAQQSMGANATDYMKKANKAAQGQAEQEAQSATRMGTKAALQGARTAGVNKGQAAMLASQQAGSTYGQTFQGGLQAGRQQYQQGAQQFAQQGAQQQGLSQGALGGQAGVQGQQLAGQQAIAGQNLQSQGIAAGQSTSATSAGMAGTQAGITNNNTSQAALTGLASGAVQGAIGLATSDRNLKTNITSSKGRSLEDLIRKVKAVEFDYKPGVEDGGHHSGVIAQELETFAPENVMDTPQGKAVDTEMQTMTNTNLIIQMAEELFELKRKLKAMGGK